MKKNHMTDRELMQQALDAFVWNYNTDLDNIPECEQWVKLLKTNIAALRGRLAQPKQEPVAVVSVRPLRGDESIPKTIIDWKNGNPVAGPLYTYPPQRKPLTFEEILSIAEETRKHVYPSIAFARAVEAAHGIKE